MGGENAVSFDAKISEIVQLLGCKKKQPVRIKMNVDLINNDEKYSLTECASEFSPLIQTLCKYLERKSTLFSTEYAVFKFCVERSRAESVDNSSRRMYCVGGNVWGLRMATRLVLAKFIWDSNTPYTLSLWTY